MNVLNKEKNKITQIFIYIMLILWGLFVLFPFYWMVLTSLKGYSAYNSEYIPKFFTLSPTFENYHEAFISVPLGDYFLNTIIFTVFTVAIMLLVIVPAAFAFARLEFKGKNLLFTLFLSLMMIPGELVIITNYVTITNFDLRNTFTGLILPSVMSVFYVYLLRESFMSIPDELYYAAKVSGTSDFKYMMKVAIPLCKPTIITVTILKVIECWNSFVWPRLITDEKEYFLLSGGIQEKDNGGSSKRGDKRMKKFLAFLLFSLFALSLLSGCHGTVERSSFSVPENFDENELYEITFWAKNDTNKVQTAIYEKAIEDFSKLYPNIKVKMKLYNDYGKIYNDVITNISTDTTPNVCITYPDHIATYLSGGKTVVPLDELMADERYGLSGSEIKFDSPNKEDIVPEFLRECSFDEKLYALPFMRSSEVCYINKDLVNALGYEIPEHLTWDFLWEVSDKATEKNPDGTYKINGQKVMIPFIYKSTDNMMIQYLKQKNAPYSDNEGKVLLFNDEAKEFLSEIAYHTKKGSFSTFKVSSYPGNFLNAGQCIFAIDSTAGSTWIGSDAPLIDISKKDIKEFETVVKRIPQLDNENPKMISQGPSICVFNKENPGEVLASWLFLQYLLTNDVQIAYCKTEGYIPVTKKAQNSFEYKDYLERSGEDSDTYYKVKIDASKIVLENLENTFVTPVFSGSASLRNAAGTLIEETVKSVRRKELVDDNYFKELYKKVEGLYRLDSVKGNSNHNEPLPKESKILLLCLAIAWVYISAVFIKDKIKK